MKFKVDRDMCQSAAVCIAFLTKNDQPIYQLNDENKAEIITKSGDKLIDKWVETKDVNQQADSQLKDLEKVSGNRNHRDKSKQLILSNFQPSSYVWNFCLYR